MLVKKKVVMELGLAFFQRSSEIFQWTTDQRIWNFESYHLAISPQSV
jgi:hypothetical protein